MNAPNALEMAVLRKLFDGEGVELTALRAQLPHVTTATRKLTGVGFFTTFALPTDVEPAPIRRRTLRFGDVAAEIEGLEHGAGFLVYVDDGKLHMLEGYSYDEPWPENFERFELSYMDESRRSVNDALAGT